MDAWDVVVHVDGAFDGADVDAVGAGFAQEVFARGLHDLGDAHCFGEQRGEDAGPFALAGGDAGAVFAHCAGRGDGVDHRGAGGFGEGCGGVDDGVGGAVLDAGVALGALGDEGELFDRAWRAVDERDVGRRRREFAVGVVVGEVPQVVDRGGGVCGGVGDGAEGALEEPSPEEVASRDLFVVRHWDSVGLLLRIVHEAR